MKKLLLSFLSVGALLFIPAATASATGFTDVSGVISFNGTHVGKNIVVTVNCNGNVLTDKTDKTGTYLVQFTKQQCPKNSTVHVSATVNGITGNSTGKAKKDTNRLNVAVVNVSVPEFGVITGIGTMVAAGGAFLVIRRRQLGDQTA